MKQEVLTDILAKIIDYRGKTPKKLGGDWSESGYRALSALQVKTTGLQNLDECHYVDENIYRKWMKEEVKRGDILMTSEAPAGQVFYWDSDEKIVLSQRLFCLRVNNEHNPIYVKYYLQSDTGQKAIFGNLSGSTVSGVSAKTLEYTTIFTRSLEEETKIANVLYSIDKKIDINNKIIETSEKLMREIYDYWFVQFDFPDENDRPYKSSGGKMVYNETLRREIPKGWSAVQLKDIADIKSGFSFSSDDYVSGGEYKIITIKNVQDGFIDYDTDNTIDFIPDKMPLWCKLEGSEILMSLTGNTGRIGLTFGKKALLNQRVAKIEPKDKTMNPFLYILLGSDSIQNKIQGLSNGSSQKNLSPIQLSNIFIAYNERYSNEISKLLEPSVEMIVQKYSENRKLSSLRDWLLPMLMNGQIKVSDQ